LESSILDDDGDGVVNELDLVNGADNDSDQDGIFNSVETKIGSNPLNEDSDGDFINDAIELGIILTGQDADNDGIDDAMDADTLGLPDLNGDGIADSAVRDTDDDGEPDLLDKDSDGDGIEDSVEDNTRDSDNDGILDHLDPVDGSDGNVQVGGGDSDGDGIPDILDCCRDSDFDGIPDYTEDDSDADFVSDSIEASLSGIDSDDDGLDDTLDADADGDGSTDAGKVDANGDGVNDFLLDTDGDGLYDFQDPDSDNDGLLDELESGFGTPSMIPMDSDDDGIPDRTDASSVPGVAGGGDSDNDGLTDADECPEAKLEGYAACADSDNDGTPDYFEVNEETDLAPTEPTSPVNNGNGITNAVQTGTSSSGSMTMMWSLLGLLLVRRRHLLMLGVLFASFNSTAAEVPNDDRFFFTGLIDYSLFTPETAGSGVTITDDADFGYTLGMGYDVSSQWALQGTWSDHGATIAEFSGNEVDIDYASTSLVAQWYPLIMGTNARYLQQWPRQFNWFVSGGLSKIYTGGTASTEVQNFANATFGVGATYGFTGNLLAKATLTQVSGDVMTFGLGLSWYPFAPMARGIVAEEVVSKPNVIEAVDISYEPAPVSNVPPVRQLLSLGAVEAKQEDQCQIERSRADVLFGYDSSFLKAAFYSSLDKAVADFFKCPDMTITLVGYADSRGSQSYNIKLALKRARSVEDYLTNRGVPANRILTMSKGVDDSLELMEFEKRRVDVFFGDQTKNR
ncbi:MAG: OmpA family protein, partial [Oleibacter sp.]|nr:OmpA family protein [Thalassolituus sp.]